MKKLLLLLFIVGYSVQGLFAQFSIGPELGMNLSTINETTPSGTTTLNGLNGLALSYNYTYGARAGVMMEYGITDDIAVQSGVYYSMLGAKITAQNLVYQGIKSSVGESSKNINYFSVPVYAVYKADAGKGRFFVGLGMYASFGVGGIVKTGAINLDTLGTYPSSSRNVTFGSDSASVKALDYGIGAITGYQFENGFILRLGYNYGLANYSNLKGTTTSNSCFFFSLAWLFSNNSGRR